MEQAYEKVCQANPPRCDRCGSVLRPDVVLFGESLPQDQLETAIALAGECEVFLSIGSSLVVYPAANLPVIAKSTGAKLVIINIDPTPLDSIADLVLKTSAGEALSFVLNA